MLVFILAGLGCRQAQSPHARKDPLSQNVYLWQREWTAAVTNSLVSHRAAFQKCIVLNAEISWTKTGPRIVTAPLDYEALRQSPGPIGLALRIGAFSGPFGTNSPAFRAIRSTASAMLRKAQFEKIEVSELHLDFDCAESKLKGYLVWLEGLKQALPGTPLSITALPAWLKRKFEFGRLLEPLSSYVLQVHSLERPKSIEDHISLCDSGAARKAISDADRFQKPFLVALPTYGYLLAFDNSGRFAGLQAESAARFPGTNFTVLELRSSPQEMARLVREWSQSSPQNLRGIIWYRLPVPSDKLNWSWTTLETVMHGIEPTSELKVEVRAAKPALYEIFLRNVGTDEYAAPLNVAISNNDGTVLASDGLGNFVITNRGPHKLNLQSTAKIAPLPPRSERKIGWIRTTQPLDSPFETHFSTH